MLPTLYLGFGREVDSSGSYYFSPAAKDLSQFTFASLNNFSQCSYIECGLAYSNYKLIHYIFLNFIILKKIFFGVSRSCPIVFYHSFSILPAMLLINILGYRVIAQVNEIYSNAPYHDNILMKFLEPIILKRFSNFVLSTPLLKEYIKFEGKKFCIVPGPFWTSQPSDVGVKRKSSVVRIVYAGIIDSRKNTGAFDAIEFVQQLPAVGFKLDIYGFGLEDDVKQLKSRCVGNVSYNGSVSPDELSDILSNYDVGLALQNVKSPFSATSYPSKIIKYLSCGIDVIASATPAVIIDDIAGVVAVHRLESDPLLTMKKLFARSKDDKAHLLSGYRNKMLVDLKEVVVAV